MRALLACLVLPTVASGDPGYGRTGVKEIGVHTGVMLAPDLRSVNVSPLVGWFVADNFEVSAIASVSNIKAGSASTTVWASLVEPSYHVPLNQTTFGFLGMGVGAAYIAELGGGLIIAPRIGANVMVGRAGVLTPSVSYETTTHNASEMMDDITLAAVSSTMRINIGYTMMW